MNCLAPDLKDFPSKRALDNPRGTLLKPSSGGLGGHWRAGARAGELGGGDLNCAPNKMRRIGGEESCAGFQEPGTKMLTATA